MTSEKRLCIKHKILILPYTFCTQIYEYIAYLLSKRSISFGKQSKERYSPRSDYLIVYLATKDYKT